METLKFHLEHFDGPLDLLLQLIAKNKVNIYDIPIAKILEQYLAIIGDMERFDPDLASEFIAMAAHLVYIKSKLLLPRHTEEEEDPREKLVEMLLEYEKFKKVSQLFHEKSKIGQDIFVKPPEIFEKTRQVDYNHTIEELILAFYSIFETAKRKLPPEPSAFSGIVGHEVMPVSFKIEQVLLQFLSKPKILVKELFLQCTSRTELIATFLAILELCKTQKLSMQGNVDHLLLELL